jgi:hypothetical protein
LVICDHLPRLNHVADGVDVRRRWTDGNNSDLLPTAN